MEQTAVNAVPKTARNKKVWLPVVIVLAIAALVVVLFALAPKMLDKDYGRPAPVMLVKQSSFSMYEERPDEVLLTYSVTLRNDTGSDLPEFALRAELQSDYKSGYILSPNASVRMWGQQNSTFSLAAGETTTYDLILTAKFHRTQRTASGELPQLYAVFPDGTEGRIEKKSE